MGIHVIEVGTHIISIKDTLNMGWYTQVTSSSNAIYFSENSKAGVPAPEVLAGLPYLKNKTREELLDMTAEELKAIIDMNTPDPIRHRFWGAE